MNRLKDSAARLLARSRQNGPVAIRKRTRAWWKAPREHSRSALEASSSPTEVARHPLEDCHGRLVVVRLSAGGHELAVGRDAAEDFVEPRLSAGRQPVAAPCSLSQPLAMSSWRTGATAGRASPKKRPQPAVEVRQAELGSVRKIEQLPVTPFEAVSLCRLRRASR